MDWLQTVANVAQVVGVIWVLVFGGKAVADVIGDLARRQPIKIKGIAITNVLLALILLAVLSYRVIIPSPSPSTPSAPNSRRLLHETTQWVHNLEGWTGSKQWYEDGGLLKSDGSAVCCQLSNVAIYPPYDDLPDDYVIETSLRETGIRDPKSNYTYFGVFIRGTHGTYNGYSVLIDGPTQTLATTELNIPSLEPQYRANITKNVEDVLGNSWHTCKSQH